MAPFFFCNKCFMKIINNGTKFLLTSCGHIYCDRCLAGEHNKCFVCQSEFTTIQLSANLAPDLQIFFSEYVASLQKIVKVYEFQASQTALWAKHWEKEAQILQHKYSHAKEFIKKITAQSQSLSKDHERLKNLFKVSIMNSSASGNSSFRTPAGTEGSPASTSITTPTSTHQNNFMWNRKSMGKTVPSNQNNNSFRTPPSVYQSTPSVASGMSGISVGSRVSQLRGMGPSSGYPRRPGYNLPSPNTNLAQFPFGSAGRHPHSGGNRAP